MFEEDIKEYFTKTPFNNKKFPIITDNCLDDVCELKGDFKNCIILKGDNIVRCLKVNEKSVDFIVFAKKIHNNKVDVVLCEVTTGQKTFDDVLQKIRSSGEYILKVFEKLGYSVRNFDCIYLGNYKNESRLPISQGFTIPGFWRNDLRIDRYECGVNISQIKDLNFKQYQ